MRCARLYINVELMQASGMEQNLERGRLIVKCANIGAEKQELSCIDILSAWLYGRVWPSLVLYRQESRSNAHPASNAPSNIIWNLASQKEACVLLFNSPS
jgi:hypothetical protein